MFDEILNDPRAAPADREPLPEAGQMRVLFVDPDQRALDRLRDAVHRSRRPWNSAFVTGGVPALTALANEPIDVVVVDLAMPSMDGAALLAHVQACHPSTMRVAVSSDPAAAVVARAAVVAHRFLGKPVDVEELSVMMQRSSALRHLTEEVKAYRNAAVTTALPSRPGLYMQLLAVLADPNSGAEEVAAVVESDTAMTAKVLSLANSGMFGVGRHVTKLREAVMYLGTDMVRSLTLSAEAFGKFAPRSIAGFSIDGLQEHATQVARIVSAILPKGRMQQDAVTAALLHDIGKLVWIAEDPEGFTKAVEEARRSQRPLPVVEAELTGVTHAALGAHLLALWGLPDAVVEAVAHHHDPAQVAGVDLDPITAVHIADAIANETWPRDPLSASPGALDEELVSNLGLRAQLEMWRYIVTGWANDESTQAAAAA